MLKTRTGKTLVYIFILVIFISIYPDRSHSITLMNESEINNKSENKISSNYNLKFGAQVKTSEEIEKGDSKNTLKVNNSSRKVNVITWIWSLFVLLIVTSLAIIFSPTKFKKESKEGDLAEDIKIIVEKDSI